MFWLQEVSVLYRTFVLSPQCRISLEDALAKQHVQGAAGNFFRHDKTTIVKVVMFCSSGSSSDSSAKTNQSAFRVFLAGSDKWFINYSRYRVCDDRWKLRRRLKLLPPRWLKCVGPEYVSGRVQIRFDCDLGYAKSVGRRNPSCNSRGWFMLFGEPASIKELTCINRSWQ